MCIEMMMTVLIVLSVLCGILMIATIAVCCYICARRYYIKVCPINEHQYSTWTQPPTLHGTVK